MSGNLTEEEIEWRDAFAMQLRFACWPISADKLRELEVDSSSRSKTALSF